MSTQTATPPRHSAKQQFDKQANHYDGQWNSWTRESVEWMLERAGCQATDTVLDVATGTGYTAFAFAPHVAQVVGLDVSTGMMEVAAGRAVEQGLSNVSFREGAAEALPFPDATFNFVTCRVAAHHFLDVPRFLSEVERVLRPGGHFLLADTTAPDDNQEAARWENAIELLRDPSHMRNYSMREWRGMIESAGLAVEEASNQGGGIDIPVSAWLTKAGVTPEREAKVREMLATAPESARREFKIREEDGESYFTWKRVVVRAGK